MKSSIRKGSLPYGKHTRSTMQQKVMSEHLLTIVFAIGLSIFCVKRRANKSVRNRSLTNKNVSSPMVIIADNHPYHLSILQSIISIFLANTIENFGHLLKVN